VCFFYLRMKKSVKPEFPCIMLNNSFFYEEITIRLPTGMAKPTFYIACI
jgi:hypothetical protein